MKTIDTRSLLSGMMAAFIIFILSGSKMHDSSENIEFVSSPTAIGIYNKTTKKIFLYKLQMGGVGVQENPSRVYEVLNDGAGLAERNN